MATAERPDEQIGAPGPRSRAARPTRRPRSGAPADPRVESTGAAATTRAASTTGETVTQEGVPASRSVPRRRPRGLDPLLAVPAAAIVDAPAANGDATTQNGDWSAAEAHADSLAPPQAEPVAAAPVVEAPVEAPLTPPEVEPATVVVPVVAATAHTRTRIPRDRRVRPVLPRFRRRPRVRKVNRVVRRVDPWTVFKVSAVFYVVAYVIVLVAAVLLWNLAYTTGTVGNVEGFIRDLFGLKTFKFDGQKIFEASWLLGAFLAIAGTGLSVTLAVLFNLISDLVGGIRITVLEEEVILRERPARPLPAPQPAAEETDPTAFAAPVTTTNGVTASTNGG